MRLRSSHRELTLYSMKTSIIVLLVLFVFAFRLSADTWQKAYTEDGRTVILRSDGQWKYQDEETQPSESEYDFRKVAWGMSKNAVKSAETDSPVHESDESLGYGTNVAGLPCGLHYQFSRNRLAQASYFFTITHSNDNDYIDDFHKLEDLLEKKYGRVEPPSTGTPKPRRLNPSAYQSTSQTWKNSLYKDDPENWGLAVAAGHLVYRASWETERTSITLVLWGDNYEIFLAIAYEGKELSESFRKAQERSGLDDL